MRAFLKAVAIGTLAGAGPMLVMTVILAIVLSFDKVRTVADLADMVSFALLPVLIAAPIVFAASILFGLPLKLVLRRNGWERGSRYIGAGVAIGGVLPPLALWIAGAPAGYWMAFLGMIAGGATARSWWRDRAGALTAANSPLPARSPHRRARS